MDKKTPAPSETAQRILAAARDAFTEHGFSGTTVDAIAQSAGVNKATLYYHIGDKETLYGEVVRSVLESTVEDFQKDLQEARDPEEQLRHYIRTMAATVESNPWLPRIILRELAGGGISRLLAAPIRPAHILLGQQVYSFDQAAVAVDLAVSWANGAVAATFDGDWQTRKTRFVLKFTQNFYTVSAAPPATPDARLSL